MIFDYDLPERSELRRAVSAAYRTDETECVARLLEAADFPEDARQRIAQRAEDLVKRVREKPKEGGVEALMYEYELSSHEGIVLMCLAEALLRVPDAATVDRLINDKITSADWSRHLGHSDSLFVNASTWAFMLTGNLLAAKDSSEHDFRTTMTGILARTGEPVIRRAVTHAMKLLGRQFIMGTTIDSGLERAKAYEKTGYRFSYDMLGEAARTNADAEYFFASYSNAIKRIGEASNAGPIEGPGLSVKLSALDPRYSFSQYERTMAKLLPKMRALALLAKEADIGLTIDAEEADRLELKMDILEALAGDPDLAGWNGTGASDPGLSETHLFPLRLADRPGPTDRPAAHGSLGERRLLGHRDQALPGRGAERLSRLHPQGLDRCFVYRLRQETGCQPGRHLPSVRDP